VCSPSGKVVRIVIFRKASLLHAMVEFDSVETASHAKRYGFFKRFFLQCCGSGMCYPGSGFFIHPDPGSNNDN
jgi:hypothetical protein